jgi:hypothetical protein
MNAQRLMQQVIWYLRQWRQYAGILAIAGLALLLLAGALYIQKLQPIQKDLERRELGLLEAARKLQQSSSSASATATASSVAERLPQSNQFTAFLLKLNTLAEQKKIVLQQSDYKATSEVGGELLRYGLQFPANGLYPDIQQFITELEKIPGVRIETLNLSRPQISDAMLNVQIEMSYLSEVQP